MDKTTQDQIDAATYAAVEADNVRAAERHVAHAAESFAPVAAPKTTREKICDILGGYVIDEQDALSGAASHEARRLIAAGAKLGDELSAWAREDARKLLGRELTSNQADQVYQVTHLYLLDQEELERAGGGPIAR